MDNFGERLIEAYITGVRDEMVEASTTIINLDDTLLKLAYSLGMSDAYSQSNEINFNPIWEKAESLHRLGDLSDMQLLKVKRELIKLESDNRIKL